MKKIVILGASYAGVSTAHRILKQISKTGPFKIILVSPNTDLYWNIAAPRGLIPELIADEQLFRPIATGFKQYPASHFEFILASAESLDVEAKKVGLTSSTGASTLDYDFLILATGTNEKGDTPFKSLQSTEATKAAVHNFQSQVKNAKIVVIAGAGVTGVEAAGELGFEYGRQKDIILIANGSTVLNESPPHVGKTACKELQRMNVDIKFHTKVQSVNRLPDGRHELFLSDGNKITADMYIPTFGQTANSSYIPTKFLNEEGYVTVDEYLQVRGAKDVWAIGDVSDMDFSQLIPCDRQSSNVAKNIVLILNNKAPIPYKAMKSTMMSLQIGRKVGTGHFGDWRLPSFLIMFMRKTLYVEMMGPMVDGTRF